VRRTYTLNVDLSESGEVGERTIGLEVWEVKEGIKIEKVKPVKEGVEDEGYEPGSEEEEEEEEVEMREKTIEKEAYLGALKVRARQGRQTSIVVQFLIGVQGKLEVSAYERGKDGTKEVQKIVVV
jgi:heat shock 70kDa protein 1/2/6/8